MSLYLFQSGLLAVKPRVTAAGDLLHVHTPLLLQVLSLGSYDKHVCIDRSRKIVTISRRLLWVFFRRREIPYSRIVDICTDHGALPTGWNFWVGATDEIEKYVVYLELQEPREEVTIYSVIGEGAIETRWTGTIFGDDSVVDFHGDQKDAFQAFLDLVREYIGSTLRHVELLTVGDYICEKCGRKSPPAYSSCMYCEGKLVRVE